MTNKKNVCENLYKDYLKLAEKTHIRVETYVPGRPLTPQQIDPADLLKKEEIRLKLLDCKDSLNLSPEDWFEIENG